MFLSNALTRRCQLLMAASSIAALSAGSAFAEVTPGAVMDNLTRLMTKQGVSIDVENARMDGADVVLDGVAFTTKDADEATQVGTVRLSDITEADNGSFEVGNASWQGLNISAGGNEFSIGPIRIENLYLPSEAETRLLLKNGYYTRLSIGPASLAENGTQLAKLDGVEVGVSPYDAEGPVLSTLAVSNMLIDMQLLDDAKSIAAMEAMGYSQLTGDLTSAFQWDQDSGNLSIDQMTLAIDDAADLAISGSVGGYTRDVADAMQELASQQSPNGGNDEAVGMAMFGMLQQLDFNNLSITLKDQSLTGRIMDFVGAQQGMDRKSLAAMAKGMVPFMLMQLQAPEFAAQATGAISKFLDDPDTIKISASPEQSVPFAVLMAGAMGGSPQDLLKTLNVQVTNDE